MGGTQDSRDSREIRKSAKLKWGGVIRTYAKKEAVRMEGKRTQNTWSKAYLGAINDRTL